MIATTIAFGEYIYESLEDTNLHKSVHCSI
jgi:hypothetical protein